MTELEDQRVAEEYRRLNEVTCAEILAFSSGLRSLITELGESIPYFDKRRIKTAEDVRPH